MLWLHPTSLGRAVSMHTFCAYLKLTMSSVLSITPANESPRISARLYLQQYYNSVVSACHHGIFMHLLSDMQYIFAKHFALTAILNTTCTVLTLQSFEEIFTPVLTRQCCAKSGLLLPGSEGFSSLAVRWMSSSVRQWWVATAVMLAGSAWRQPACVTKMRRLKAAPCKHRVAVKAWQIAIMSITAVLHSQLPSCASQGDWSKHKMHTCNIHT